MKSKFALCLSLLLLVGGVGFFVQSHLYSDRTGYHTLFRQVTGESGARVKRFRQNRQGVCKEMWIPSQGERLRMQLRCSDSVLVIEKNELVEKMQGVVCLMQEELYYLLPDGREIADPGPGYRPMQVLRVMESESATYYYGKDKFVADQAKIRRYKLPGHVLPSEIEAEQPTMAGQAKSVEFSLVGSEPKFKAHQLKATLYSSGGRS